MEGTRHANAASIGWARRWRRDRDWDGGLRNRPHEGTAHLNQVRLRGPRRAGFGPATIELGNEPPLSVDGQTGMGVDRRRVSVQWFSGTILTGLCGAALMGGAVFASLDGETNFAASGERFEAATRAAVADKNSSRKSDKLPPVGETNGARQVLRVSTITRVGNREVVRARPLVRVATNLSLSTSELSASIPPFNPQRMLASNDTPGAGDQAGSEPDAEVSFVTRDLGALLPRMRVAATTGIDDVISRVRDAANWTGSSTATPYMVASVQPNARLGYAAEGGDDPYARIGERGVPENFTLLPKTVPQGNGGPGANERTITVKKGDNVGGILRDLGATPPTGPAASSSRATSSRARRTRGSATRPRTPTTSLRVSARAASRRTSRFCRRPRASRPAGPGRASAPSRRRRATASPASCAISARHPTTSRGSPHCSAPRAATAASRRARSCASCSRPPASGCNRCG